MIYQADVQITTPLKPTERQERVEEAIRNLFPAAEIEASHGELRGRTHSVDAFADRLAEQAIVDTAREVFYENRSGDTISFDLKKQAAYEGVVNFAVGAPDELGDMHVRIRIEEPSVEAFIDHLAPGTASSD